MKGTPIISKLTGFYRRLNRILRNVSLVAVACASLTGSRQPTLLETIQEAGELVVISRNGPTTYYEGRSGYTGFEYTLLKSFARTLGVRLVIKDVEDLGQVIDEVGRLGHFAAAGLTVTARRSRQVQFSEPYLRVTQQLIYHVEGERPLSIDDLINSRLLVIGNSSHAEYLRRLQNQHPELTWEERHDVEMLDLLEMVHNRKIDYTIVDSNAFELNNSLYPKAQVAFSLSEPEPVAWAFPHSRDRSLLDAANRFLTAAHSNGTLADLTEQFYGHLGEIGYSGALLFTERMNSRLPQWRSLLQKASEETDLPWELLAALSYQESHWNPKARSPTGVRGFMMLTLNTAKEVNVTNRLDPEQSIHGGAIYYRKLLDRLPENIKGQDRIWLSLAAYNVGYGHLQDARTLAQRHGANPDKWSDVKEFLPLLAKRQYYKHTRHGYARGHEAVTFVQNIRNFYGILAWNEVEKDRLIDLANAENEKNKESAFNAVISELVANESFTPTAM